MIQMTPFVLTLNQREFHNLTPKIRKAPFSRLLENQTNIKGSKKVGSAVMDYEN